MGFDIIMIFRNTKFLCGIIILRQIGVKKLLLLVVRNKGK